MVKARSKLYLKPMSLFYVLVFVVAAGLYYLFRNNFIKREGQKDRGDATNEANTDGANIDYVPVYDSNGTLIGPTKALPPSA
jgi:hypothetical protein